MKIGVIGAGKDLPELKYELANEVGKEIVRNKCVLVTGGCFGYPNAAVKGALEEGGKTIAISPAKDEKEHVGKYGFPLEQSEIIYTGLGIPGRNKEVVLNSDVIIMIGGEIGTLNEMTYVLYEKKALGVMLGSGGVTEVVPQIIDVCKRYKGKSKIVYSDDPKELVKKLIEVIK